MEINLNFVTKNNIVEKNKEDMTTPSVSQPISLKDWDKLFVVSDTTPETEFKDWDVALEDGIE